MKIKQDNLFWVAGWLFDFTKLVSTLAIVLLVIHYYAYTVFVVKGNSMEPNFHDGDIVILDRLHYKFNQPSRGDVIGLYFPGEKEKKYIKRITGLPKEGIVVEGGSVRIDGIILKEPYKIVEDAGFSSNVYLKEGEFFVLGDNRVVSSDSRTWGALPKEYIIGKELRNLGSINKITNKLFRQSKKLFNHWSFKLKNRV